MTQMEVQDDTVTETDVNDAAVFGGDPDDALPFERSQETPAAPAQAGAADGISTAESLLTDEEITSLVNNPAELRRLVSQRHTEKLSKFDELERFRQAFEADPVSVVTNLARRYGVLKDVAPATPAQAEPTFEEKTFARLSGVLGPQLAKEMTAIIVDTARTMAQQEVGPLRQTLQQGSAQAAQAQATAIVETYFTKTNPEAVKYQEKMFSLMSKILPGEGMSDTEWLDLLYEQASKPARQAQAAAVTGRQVAAALSKTKGEQVRTAAPANVVAKAPNSVVGKKGGMNAARRAAFDAALRGERYAD